MTLPFTSVFRGHYRVIKWHDFNIIVSQRTERLKERERQGRMTGHGSSPNTKYLSISIGIVPGVSKQLQ
jgi:hypothetical protein